MPDYGFASELADELRPYATLLFNVSFNRGARRTWDEEMRRRGIDPAVRPIPREHLRPTVEAVPPEVAEAVMEMLLDEARGR